ncbi:hypothetical protein H012_gp451 [Acanthamoeba polyphaga moumouvirus]|uniref:Uncharacterized protein n=1 Tax=Acanthamoeba polyphaga moumouvirus TaxID=1269028 RepID=L7RD56_9VIRU|nr:hypothetical protein H012_gp451 [Acanthamoeba polyphaga moumouvirus]AGC02008.1 hypothetical protein Moumou_00474 [Acanthamoeba polyphaga moumouvirus]
MANFDYYNFRIQTVTQNIKREIDFYLNSEFANQPPLCDYIAYLKNRIGTDRLEMPKTYYDNNRLEMKKMNLDEYAKDMDIMVYKKPWNKLKDFHKIMKIKEYVNKLPFGKKINKEEKEKNMEYIKQEIINGLKNKKFGKNKSEIIYNPDNMEITSISCVYLNKKKGIYAIDWDD